MLKRQGKSLCETRAAASNNDGENLVVALVVILNKLQKPRILPDFRHQLLKQREIFFKEHSKNGKDNMRLTLTIRTDKNPRPVSGRGNGA